MMRFRKIPTLLFVFVFCLVSNCTVRYVKSAPEFEKSLTQFKRVVVILDSTSSIGLPESGMAKSMSEQYLAHHKEFIVYPNPKNKGADCSGLPGKAQGIFTLKLTEESRKSEIRLSALGQLKNCSSNTILWEALASATYSTDGEDEQSLRKTYTQKFGESVASKAVPYYHLLRALFDELTGPVLNEAEQDEKIEIESQS